MPQALFRSPPRRPQAAAAADDDDDDHATLLRSAGSVRYGDASGASPASAEAAQQYPALAADAGPVALVERVKLVLQDEAELLPEQLAKFKHETVLTGLKLHLRSFGIAKESDYASGGTLAPIVIQRPAFNETFFHVRPPSAGEAAGELDYYSVPNRALSSLMVRRGFPLIGVTHLPADESKLPRPIAELEATRATARAAEDELAAPTELKVPTGVKDIEQGGSAPTVAAQIVEQFELRVVMRKDNGRSEVFSPMRLWTKEARKQAKFKGSASTPFSVRCMLYYFIRSELADQEPSSISTSYDQLRADAEVIKARKASKAGKQKKRRRSPAGLAGLAAAAAAAEAPAVAPEDLLCGEWFDLAVGLSKGFVS